MSAPLRFPERKRAGLDGWFTQTAGEWDGSSLAEEWSSEPGTLGDSSTQGRGLFIHPVAAQGCLAAETEGSRDGRGVEGHAGMRWPKQAQTPIPATGQPEKREAGIKPGRPSLEPSASRTQAVRFILIWTLWLILLVVLSVPGESRYFEGPHVPPPGARP